MTTKVHIAGMLVHARVDSMQRAMDSLHDLGNAEVHPTGISGKFIVVLECARERELAEIIERLQAQPGVVSVSMTSHYIEDAAALAMEMPE